MNFSLNMVSAFNFMRSALTLLCVLSLLAAVPADVANAASKKASKQTSKRGDIIVKIETSMGNIELSLDKKKAPVTVENFLDYVNAGFYNNTVFHRVIKDFMIQGGGFDADMNMKTSEASIKNEASNGLKNLRYTIAMARTSDPHSASSQFFINSKENKFLNYKSSDAQGWGYAVFGKVLTGQDVVDKISKVKTASGDVPVVPVIIKSISVVQ